MVHGCKVQGSRFRVQLVQGSGSRFGFQGSLLPPARSAVPWVSPAGRRSSVAAIQVAEERCGCSKGSLAENEQVVCCCARKVLARARFEKVIVGLGQRPPRNSREARELAWQERAESFGQVPRCRARCVADLIPEKEIPRRRSALGFVEDPIAKLDTQFPRVQILKRLHARHVGAKCEDRAEQDRAGFCFSIGKDRKISSIQGPRCRQICAGPRPVNPEPEP
jgi:hypothetical protein